MSAGSRSSPPDADLPFPDMRGQARRARLCADPGKWLRLDPRASADLAIEGSGILRKLWCVFNADGEPNVAMNALRAHRDLYRNIWIHIAFDDSGSVQVSAPLADFFLLGHGDVGDVDSHYFQAVRIPPLDESPYQGALTCFAPMPFGERVKISFVNGNSIPVRLIASIDWLERTHTASPLYFHASYRHGRCHREPIVVLDKRNVRGSFVGLGLYVTNPDGANWWHEGCESFDIDGHRDAIVGTGAEDYFCLAWGFRRLVSRPLFGVTCLRPSGGSPLLTSGRFNPAGEFAMYRLHVHDPVSFRRSLRLRFTPAVAERVDNGAPLEFRSVAFWYGRDIEPEPGDATGTPPASHV